MRKALFRDRKNPNESLHRIGRKRRLPPGELFVQPGASGASKANQRREPAINSGDSQGLTNRVCSCLQLRTNISIVASSKISQLTRKGDL
jgi:hypothetical protein